MKPVFYAMLLSALLAAAPALAQEAAAPVGWQHEVGLSLGLLQSSYSSNWNGGDKGSVVWAANIDGLLEKQMSPSLNWRNTLKLAYGQTHKQDRTAAGKLVWLRPDKTVDTIELESLMRWTRDDGWDPFAAFAFHSLFQDLSDPQRALNLNPKTFKESAGLSRQFVKTDERELMWRVGVAFIQNSRKYFSEPYPSEATGSESSSEVAAEMVTEYKSKVLDGRVGWESKLTLTQPFHTSSKSIIEDGFTSAAALPADLADYTTVMDADWENTFSADITKVISVKLYVRWVYDKYDNSVEPVVDEGGALVNEADVRNAIRKAGQFKQALALSFGYKF